jgi:hypothetical protein
MNHQIKLAEVAGKTLNGVALDRDGRAALVFSDGTFAGLGIKRGFEACDEEIEEADIDLLEFHDDDLIALGAATAEELTATRARRRAEQEAAARASTESRERREFERLSKKFGAP